MGQFCVQKNINLNIEFQPNSKEKRISEKRSYKEGIIQSIDESSLKVESSFSSPSLTKSRIFLNENLRRISIIEDKLFNTTRTSILSFQSNESIKNQLAQEKYVKSMNVPKNSSVSGYENNDKISKVRNYNSKEISLIIRLQKLRRNVVDNQYFIFTKKAKKYQKEHNRLETFITHPIINQIEISNPFNLNNWENFYHKTEDLHRFTFTIKNTFKIRLIDSEQVYIGEVNESYERHGFGTLINRNKGLFKGIWLKNKINGWCRNICFYNKDDKTLGKLIEGNFIDNILNGYGEITMENYSYKGHFVEDKPEGFGIEKTNNFIYEGDFLNGKKHGKGKIKYLNKDEEYEGDFVNDNLTGKGYYVFSNKNTYNGSFQDGKLHGSGIFSWADGSQYNGQFNNNIKEGKGKFKWKNGRIFDGPFVNGKQHGIGKLIYEGNSHVVEFKEGALVKNKKYFYRSKSTNDLIKKC